MSTPTAALAADGAGTRTATAGTGARTDQAAAEISEARRCIDALDERIIGLVRERMTVSADIQQARIASGGRRVNLLELCRGRT
jgi:chorismate mutase